MYVGSFWRFCRFCLSVCVGREGEWDGIGFRMLGLGSAVVVLIFLIRVDFFLFVFYDVGFSCLGGLVVSYCKVLEI